MCGRFQLTVPWSVLVGMYGFADTPMPATPSFQLPRPNVAPTDTVPLIHSAGSCRTVELVRWGFPATWLSRGGGDPFSRALINARSEEAADKPTWRGALRSRRGIVPMSAWIEWLRDGRARLPLRFHRRDGQPIGVAALWGDFPRAGAPVRCVALLTTAALPPADRVHDRMPALIPMKDVHRWLDPDTSAEDVAAMLAPTIDPTIQITPLGTAINRAGTQDMCAMEADWPGLPDDRRGPGERGPDHADG